MGRLLVAVEVEWQLVRQLELLVRLEGAEAVT
jgi:hypothetical protein